MANKETEGRIFPQKTAAELAESNPILKDGQLFITKEGIIKIGDGHTHWMNLRPVVPSLGMLEQWTQWHGVVSQNPTVYPLYAVVLYKGKPYICVKSHNLPKGSWDGIPDDDAVINPTMPEYWALLYERN